MGIGCQVLFTAPYPFQLGLLRGEFVLQRGELRLPLRDAPPQLPSAALQILLPPRLASRSRVSWVSRAEPVNIPAGPTYTSTTSMP